MKPKIYFSPFSSLSCLRSLHHVASHTKAKSRASPSNQYISAYACNVNICRYTFCVCVHPTCVKSRVLSSPQRKVQRTRQKVRQSHVNAYIDATLKTRARRRRGARELRCFCVRRSLARSLARPGTQQYT